MSVKQAQTLLGVVAAVCAFLMLQPEVQRMPWVMIGLGCINVALAVLRPGRLASGGEE